MSEPEKPFAVPAPTHLPHGLEWSAGRLIDEQRRPDFRDVFGSLARDATRIWTAVTHVRLSTMDLTREELTTVEDFRVVVAQLSTQHLQAEVRGLQVDAQRAANLELLVDMLEGGRLAVRAAPLAGWSPDFSVFCRASGPQTVLVGTHWFGRPFPWAGPALASLHTAEAAGLAARRHAELWAGAHDVGGAVRSVLTGRERSVDSPVPSHSTHTPQRTSAAAPEYR